MTRMLPERVSTSEMILLVTSKDDLTTDYLILRLASREIPFLPIQYGRCPEAISGAFGRFPRLLILHDHRHRSQRQSAFGRDYLRLFPETPPPQSRRLRTLIPSQTASTLRSSARCCVSTWRLLPKKKWLNDPEALWSASNKVKQLNLGGGGRLLCPPPHSSPRTHPKCSNSSGNMATT